MNKNLNLTVLPEPYWLQEAYACMNYVYVLDSEEWLNKPGNWNRRRKEEFLAPYRSYREAMKARLQPVLEQYPLLAGYVDATPRERESLRSYEPPMMSFLLQMQYILEAEELPDGEQLEEELNRAFQKILGSDLQKSSDVQETEIRGLPDVMAALEEWDGTDADKFRLLRLYSERLEPGAFEIPVVAQKMAQSGKYDAILCLGAVIKGSTSHYDYVCAEVSKGVAAVGLHTGVPTMFGVLTTDNIEQAIERAGTKAGNKGYDAACAAIEMVDLMRNI